jgi:flagellar hook-associated protein 2
VVSGTAAIDGLISGLNTTSIINSLMQIEAGPQTLLKQQASTNDTLVSALQSLNVKVASLASSATTAAAPSTWQAVTASSSSSSATATTTAGAVPSSLTFTVDKLATAQTSATGIVADAAGVFGGTMPSSATIVTGSGANPTTTTFDLTGITTLAGLATAINSANTGVSASVVTISSTQSRLQLTGATGASSAFDLYAGTVTSADLTSATPPAAVVARGAATTTAGDAQITLWPGSSTPQPVTSGSNTFGNLLTGVNVTVSSVTASGATPVTVTMARDTSGASTVASNLVANISTVLSEISTQTAATTTTASDGTTIVAGGVLSGQSNVRRLSDAVLSAASTPVNGISPSTIGIVLNQDGTVTYDANLFSAALAANPTQVQAVLTGVASALQNVATQASDPTTGTLTMSITSQQSVSDQLDQQISAWDTTLTLRRTAMEKTYSDLEVSLSNLNAQSAYLTSQLNTLSSSSSSSSTSSSTSAVKF